MYRQGDVLLRKVSKTEGKKTDESNEVVLAEGEATGHAHRLRCAVAIAVYAHMAKTFIEFQQQSELTHEEHGSIILEPGCYEVIRQREYTAGEVQWVRD